MLKDQTQQYNSNCSRSKSNNFFFQCHAWHVEAVSEAHGTLCTSSNPSSYVPPNSATTTGLRRRPVARARARVCARLRSHLNPHVVPTGDRDGNAQREGPRRHAAETQAAACADAAATTGAATAAAWATAIVRGEG